MKANSIVERERAKQEILQKMFKTILLFTSFHKCSFFEYLFIYRINESELKEVKEEERIDNEISILKRKVEEKG
jgi:hypothetical protein